MRRIYYLFIIACLVGVVACSHNKRKKPNPNIPPKFVVKEEPRFNDEGDLWFIAADKTDTLVGIDIEIAETFKEREQGLMYRKSMNENHGMLFIFDQEERQSFWMKNTDIALDLIFVNANLSVVHIAKNCKPYSLEPISSFEYAKYVVEVNAGFCKKHGIKTGDNMYFEKN